MKIFKKIAILLISLSSTISTAYEVNYYSIGVTPGYEVYEYVDDCGHSHKISIKKSEFNQEALNRWIDKIAKITEAAGC